MYEVPDLLKSSKSIIWKIDEEQCALMSSNNPH